MIAALKETAVVGANGRIEIPHSDFAEGQAVEIIVLPAPATDDDAKWERLLSDEQKTANFARWAEQALAEGGEEPLDVAKM